MCLPRLRPGRRGIRFYSRSKDCRCSRIAGSAEVDALWERWEKVLNRVMAETGLDEEGLVEALAPKKTKKHEVSA
ncbi:MAG: hypothetical protein GDA56_11140 [Hormoscilla sp. GM7CHS1pb]|nr:hypothetical protein [Hormoscilla sp. GM7CHS1pb]